MAFALFPFGWLSWAAFLYIGIRGRRPVWIGLAGPYFIAAAFSFTLAGLETDPEVISWRSAVGGGLGFATWAAGTLHALAVRQTYLDRMNAVENPGLEHAEHVLRERQVALELVQHDPRHARELGVGRPDLKDAFDGGLVDLNNAPAKVIAGLPGVDARAAERAVDVREEIGGFDSLLDFADLLDIPPQTVERLRDRAVVLPR